MTKQNKVNEIINEIDEQIELIRDNLYQLYDLGFITQAQNAKLQDLVRNCGWEIGFEIDEEE